MFAFILGFFTDALAIFVMIVGAAIAAGGYLGGLWLRVQYPSIGALFAPLVVAVGVALVSGVYSYRQAIDGAEVKAKIEKLNRDIAKQKIIIETKDRQAQDATRRAELDRKRAAEAFQINQQNEGVIDGLRKDLEAGDSTRAPYDPAYVNRMRSIQISKP